ncbi:MAG TPA: histidine phosphatase family protein, partial [Candidatus Eisenbacteria bacterium]|nr:histidine phosphatase family protein [Candidatus Eisenbacteria bacterium]
MSPGRDIVFVRHGETDWNRERRVQGSQGASINDAGKEQARALSRL